jgi:hypothetical protein
MGFLGLRRLSSGAVVALLLPLLVTGAVTTSGGGAEGAEPAPVGGELCWTTSPGGLECVKPDGSGRHAVTLPALPGAQEDSTQPAQVSEIDGSRTRAIATGAHTGGRFLLDLDTQAVHPLVLTTVDGTGPVALAPDGRHLAASQRRTLVSYELPSALPADGTTITLTAESTITLPAEIGRAHV